MCHPLPLFRTAKRQGSVCSGRQKASRPASASSPGRSRDLGEQLVPTLQFSSVANPEEDRASLPTCTVPVGCGVTSESTILAFVPILYRGRAFEAFDEFGDFLESITSGASKSCQDRGSNPCRGATVLRDEPSPLRWLTASRSLPVPVSPNIPRVLVTTAVLQFGRRALGGRTEPILRASCNRSPGQFLRFLRLTGRVC